VRRIVIIFLSFCLLSCSHIGKVLNPYKSDFDCPLAEKGKCTSLMDAYLESTATGSDAFEELRKVTETRGESLLPSRKSETRKERIPFQESRHTADERLSAVQNEKRNPEETASPLEVTSRLVREPVIPIMKPPRVGRVLILPYKNEGQLFMMRYVYFLVEEPDWVIGEYLSREGGK
jgi:conjugal transfer pilus assembly protein TraV